MSITLPDHESVFAQPFRVALQRQKFLAIVAYLILTIILTWPLVTQFGQAIPGDGFDGWQNYWNLWWVKRALLEFKSHPFFTPLLYHPTGVSLYFHTLNIFNGLLALPVQLFFGLIQAYNVVAVFSFVVGGYGAYLLILYLLRREGSGGDFRAPSHLAAFVGGVVYTFSPFHFAHLLGHMQVLSLEWIPFYVLALLKVTESVLTSHRFGRRMYFWPGPAKETGKAALFLALIGLCDWYYVLYCGLFTVLWLASCTWQERRWSTTWLWVAVIGIWALFALLLSPILAPMIREALTAKFMVPDPKQAEALSADLLAFLTPQEMHPLWGRAIRRWWQQLGHSTTSERMIFAGYGPLLLGLLAVIKKRRCPTARFWTVSLVAFGVLALGPVLHVAGQRLPVHLPYALLNRVVPFMPITRSVSRFDVMVMLSLAVLASLGVRKLNPRLIMIAIGLICFEFLAVPYPMSPPDTPAFYQTLAREPGNLAVLNLPMTWDRPGYLLYQTVHRRPLTVAYISRDDPRTLAERIPVLQHFRHLAPDIIAQDLAKVGASVLDYLEVGYVVLDAYKMPPGPEREGTLALAKQLFGDQTPFYHDERLTVYAVSRPMERHPFLILAPDWGARQEEDGQVARRVYGVAGLSCIAPESATLRLGIVASSPEGTRELSFVGGGKILGHQFIGPQSTVAHVDWPVQAGENELRLIVHGNLDSPDARPVIVVTRLWLDEM